MSFGFQQILALDVHTETCEKVSFWLFVLNVKLKVHGSQTEVKLVWNSGMYSCTGRTHRNRDDQSDDLKLEVLGLFWQTFSVRWMQHSTVVCRRWKFRRCRSYCKTADTHVYSQICNALQIYVLRTCSNCASSTVIRWTAICDSELMTPLRTNGVYQLHPVLPEAA